MEKVKILKGSKDLFVAIAINYLTVMTAMV